MYENKWAEFESSRIAYWMNFLLLTFERDTNPKKIEVVWKDSLEFSYSSKVIMKMIFFRLKPVFGSKFNYFSGKANKILFTSSFNEIMCQNVCKYQANNFFAHLSFGLDAPISFEIFTEVDFLENAIEQSGISIASWNVYFLLELFSWVAKFYYIILIREIIVSN